MEVIVLDEFVEVDRKELEGDDQVGSENAMVKDLDDVICVFWILLLEVLQYLELFPCLVLVSLLILDDLDSNHLFGLVVEAFEGLAEAAFPHLSKSKNMHGGSVVVVGSVSGKRIHSP